MVVQEQVDGEVQVLAAAQVLQVVTAHQEPLDLLVLRAELDIKVVLRELLHIMQEVADLEITPKQQVQVAMEAEEPVPQVAIPPRPDHQIRAAEVAAEVAKAPYRQAPEVLEL
jgi:hypothetical protein